MTSPFPTKSLEHNFQREVFVRGVGRENKVFQNYREPLILSNYVVINNLVDHMFLDGHVPILNAVFSDRLSTKNLFNLLFDGETFLTFLFF